MLFYLKEKTAQYLGEKLQVEASEILNLLELPKKLEHGHLALPVFSWSKKLKKAPPLIAQEISKMLQDNLKSDAEKFELCSHIESVSPIVGYINFKFNNLYLQKLLFESIQNNPNKIGFSVKAKGQKLVIDFSSPNVAKPMHIGHLRATIVGQAIRNLAQTQSYEVVGLNHIGDWGVQFGKLAWAYQNWGSEYDFENKAFDSLFKMYVRFHEEEEKNPDLGVQGSLVFKKLEDGDAEIHKIWKKFVEISLQEYEKVYQKLNIKFDLILGESFYNDKLAAVENELEAKNLLKESQGAQVVDLGEEMPPCLIRKSDGASLYATRDIASAIYRHDHIKADRLLYVVGDTQTLHFKQVFKVLNLMGRDWYQNCVHIGFGQYRFKDGQISTRKGKVIFLDDVLSRAIEMVEKIIEEKNPKLENKKAIAQDIGVGAIIFNDLMNDRIKNVDFDWQKALDFEGDSGPYVQYSYVRCLSVLKKVGIQNPEFKMELKSIHEQELIRLLLNYQDVLTQAFEVYKPHILAQYLLEVCRSFNHFYQNCRINDENLEVKESRAALTRLCSQIIKSGLAVLNIPQPESM